MHTLKKALLTTVASAGLAAATMLTPSVADAQEVYVNVVPPQYIAQTEPVYYGGRPHYYYNGYWMYRDGNAWRYYRQEPGYFRDWRGRYPNGRWGYYYHRR
jgi:hypothetical protein